MDMKGSEGLGTPPWDWETTEGGENQLGVEAGGTGQGLSLGQIFCS